MQESYIWIIVWVVVVVGEVVVEVVDEEVAQPWASQQLVAGLTHELPPRGGVHACRRVQLSSLPFQL